MQALQKGPQFCFPMLRWMGDWVVGTHGCGHEQLFVNIKVGYRKTVNSRIALLTPSLAIFIAGKGPDKIVQTTRDNFNNISIIWRSCSSICLDHSNIKATRLVYEKYDLLKGFITTIEMSYILFKF